MAVQTAQSLSHHSISERWRFETALAGDSVFAGVDEAGRGCLAGPVVAAAVVRPLHPHVWADVDDSKVLSARRREALFTLIQATAVGVGIGFASAAEIDELNILQASRLAMGRALANLKQPVHLALVDGLYGAATTTPVCCLPVIDGDARCPSVAAASIVAKVVRDRWMTDYAAQYPQYGFDQHAGYGTKAHLAALAAYGPAPQHRTSFAPVRAHRQVRLDI